MWVNMVNRKLQSHDFSMSFRWMNFPNRMPNVDAPHSAHNIIPRGNSIRRTTVRETIASRPNAGQIEAPYKPIIHHSTIASRGLRLPSIGLSRYDETLGRQMNKNPELRCGLMLTDTDTGPVTRVITYSSPRLQSMCNDPAERLASLGITSRAPLNSSIR